MCQTSEIMPLEFTRSIAIQVENLLRVRFFYHKQKLKHPWQLKVGEGLISCKI